MRECFFKDFFLHYFFLFIEEKKIKIHSLHVESELMKEKFSEL